MTVADALRDAARRLAAVSDTARLDAELLMAHALGAARSEMLLRQMQAAAPESFAGLIERRERHEPVAYIIGKQEFYGHEFLVRSEVLIPRADSETTVAAALAAYADPGRILDCGIGSGALLLTLLAERPMAEGVGIDRSSQALDVADANAGRLGVSDRVTVIELDWSKQGWTSGLGQFDLIVANPPYVETDAELAPSVLDFEPAGALFAGPEGLDAYRILLPQLPALLAEHGVVVLEIGATQDEAVAEIARKSGFAAELRRDLGGRPRALVLRLGLGK